MAIMDRVRRGEHDVAGVPAEMMPLLLSALAPDPASRPTLPALLADLRRPARPGGRPADESTMPLALAVPRHDDDPTDVLATDRHAARLEEVQTVAETVVDGRPVAAPSLDPRTTPLTQVQPPARAPYMQPAQPRPGSAAPGAWRPPPSGTPRLQRGLLLGGLFALVALGFATAPYVCLAATGVAALGLRTFSWTAEAVRERTWRRGPRWYDVPLAAATSPWYLLVATGGTLMLLTWSAALAFLVGLGLVLFRLPLDGSLLVMGSVLAFSLWWGPGSRRLRVPTRSLVLLGTRAVPVGWVSVAVVAVAGVLCAYAVLTSGVSWDPMPGAPWRRGTLLGHLVGWL
jgi:hypothetical protein